MTDTPTADAVAIIAAIGGALTTIFAFILAVRGDRQITRHLDVLNDTIKDTRRDQRELSQSTVRLFEQNRDQIMELFREHTKGIFRMLDYAVRRPNGGNQP